MKGLSETLKESLLTEARKPLLPEIQGDTAAKAAYSTMSIEDAKKKYKHGFLSYSQHEEAVFVTTFNEVKDIQDLLDTDDDNYSALLSMKPAEQKMVDGELFICLW